MLFRSIGILLLFMLSLISVHLPQFIVRNLGLVFSMFAATNLMISIYSFLPFFPLPGYDLLYRNLSPVSRHKLDHYRSVTMLILMVILFLFGHVLAAPVSALLSILLKTNPFLLTSVSLVIASWLFLVELKARAKD